MKFEKKLSDRIAYLEIEEMTDKIIANFTFSKYGKMSKADEKALAEWGFPIIYKYEYDPRPIVTRHPISNEIATINNFGDTTIVEIKKLDDWLFCILYANIPY